VSARDPAGRRARGAWALFDWATQPFFTLVTTFIFAPFFATALAATPVEGQALWGYATAAAGLAIALLSPVLGGIADAMGPRKPWIVAAGSLLVAGSMLLWWAEPGHPLAVPLALAGFVIGLVGAELASVFNNAMMTGLTTPDRLGRLSGLGWAMGYLGGLVALALTLAFLAANPDTGRTLVGLSPALGLDPAAREGDRASGPFSALWFVLFVLPLFLLVPDRPATGIGLRAALGGTLARLSALVALAGPGAQASAARPPEGLLRFLLANMVYQDGLVALFAFGAIYAAGLFGWTTIELGLFGILLTVAGVAGALMGGWLDDRIGGKRVVLGSILLLGAACLGILSLGPAHVLFVWPVAPAAPGDGLFASAAERAYLALGLLIGCVAGPLQASSRSLLARLAPAERLGEYFGLFALSGRITSFAGPLLVALATTATGKQQAGLAVLLALFALGGLLLAGVRDPRRPAR
jgi:UMF1 family MFS transporter